jgi:dihydropyrimidinase
VGSGGRLLVAGGTLVDAAGSRRGDALVEDDRIVAVGVDLPDEGAAVIDASGALVLPGGIDVHTHFDLPVGEVRSADDFESGTIAAACGGTTCVIDFAGAGREPPDEALAVWHDRAARAAVDYGFHLTVTSVPDDDEAAARLFAGFVDAGVSSVKLYMAYPERLMVDDATLGRAFAAGVRAGVLVCVHAEDGLAVERLVRERLDAGDIGPDALSRARPPVVEADAVRRAATLATEAGSPVYVVHLSSAAGLEAVRSANAGGARVLAETCPQYLFLTDEALRRAPEEAANFVCQPPVRADADREALWDGLAAGPVGVISTDHCPFTVADRRAGVSGEGWTSFAEIPGGQPGVETRLGLAYQGVRDGRFSVERWVDLVAGAPARLFGLAHRKGALQEGLDADLLVFDPEATRRLDAASLHMRTDHSPYADLEVRGWPAVTIARGRVVARDGEPADLEAGRGRFVPRGRSSALA